MAKTYGTIGKLTLTLLLGIGFGPPCLAQSGPTIVTSGGSGSANVLLDPEFRNDAKGLRICPPAGCKLTQTASEELISFVQEKHLWAGNVHVAAMKRDYTMEQYLKENADALNTTFKGVSIEKSEVFKLGDRTAGRQISAMQIEQTSGGKTSRIAFYKQDIMLQVATNQFVHLTMFTPLADKDLATKTFDAMLGTFSIVDVNAVKRQRQVNLATGQAWLAKLTAQDLDAKLVRDPQFFRIYVQDKEFGYVRFDEKEQVKDGMKGPSIIVHSYSFLQDGTILTSLNTAWWPLDKDGAEVIFDAVGRSSWETLIRTFPPPGGKDWNWSSEKGLDMYDHVLKGLTMEVSLDKGNDQAMLPNRTLSTGHRYACELPPLPKTLEYTWPRLVDLTKPGVMSFPVYNSTTQKLGCRTLTIVGNETISIDGKEMKAFHLTDELDSNTTDMWSDKDGHLIMMRTSDGATLTPANKQQTETKYEPRLLRINQ